MKILQAEEMERNLKLLKQNYFENINKLGRWLSYWLKQEMSKNYIQNLRDQDGVPNFVIHEYLMVMSHCPLVIRVCRGTIIPFKKNAKYRSSFCCCKSLCIPCETWEVVINPVCENHSSILYISSWNSNNNLDGYIEYHQYLQQRHC